MLATSSSILHLLVFLILLRYRQNEMTGSHDLVRSQVMPPNCKVRLSVIAGFPKICLGHADLCDLGLSCAASMIIVPRYCKYKPGSSEARCS